MMKLNFLLLVLCASVWSCTNEASKQPDAAAATTADTTQAVATTKAATADLLQGKWQSTDDATNFLVFEKDHRKETAAGMDKWDDEVFALGDKCQNAGDKDKEIESEKDRYISCAASDMCWYIIDVNDSLLSLSYMGRGNTLNYKKVK